MLIITLLLRLVSLTMITKIIIKAKSSVISLNRGSFGYGLAHKSHCKEMTSTPPILSTYQTTRMKCAYLCMQTVGCFGCNYNISDRSCVLFSESTLDNNVISDESCVHYSFNGVTTPSGKVYTFSMFMR